VAVIAVAVAMRVRVADMAVADVGGVSDVMGVASSVGVGNGKTGVDLGTV